MENIINLDMVLSKETDGNYSIKKVYQLQSGHGNAMLFPTIDEVKIIKLMLDQYINDHSEDDIYIKNKEIERKASYKYIITHYKNLLDKKGIVYVMQNTITKFYKIGFTAKNVESRNKQIKYNENEENIEILFFYPGSMFNEYNLHNIFADANTEGEWFNLSDRDIKYIHDYFLSEKKLRAS